MTLDSAISVPLVTDATLLPLRPMEKSHLVLNILTAQLAHIKVTKATAPQEHLLLTLELRVCWTACHALPASSVYPMVLALKFAQSVITAPKERASTSSMHVLLAISTPLQVALVL